MGLPFEDMKRMCLSGEKPLGEAKTKAPNSDYHKNESPVAARQAEAARDYPKRAARIDELNGHLSGSNGPMVTALKRFNGGRMLVFVMGAIAEMPGDMSRICDITAHDLAWIHILYFNGGAQRTMGMCWQRTQKAWGHGAPRLGPSPPRPHPGFHHPRPGAPQRTSRPERPGRHFPLDPPREGGGLRRHIARAAAAAAVSFPPFRRGGANWTVRSLKSGPGRRRLLENVSVL